MNKILIFAGTSEGRRLIETLGKGISADCCVATSYGKELLPEQRKGLHILQGRLDVDEIAAMMKESSYDMVIDTTHPYARIVTENIKAAAEKTATPYIRLLRESRLKQEGIILVETMEAAVDYLNQTDEKALLTIGSKELFRFTEVTDYRQRLYPRVLPMAEVVRQCTELGFSGNKLICMQGPFSVELNEALLKQTGAKILVTKDSGSAGGFSEKVQAAQNQGAKILVVGRPTKEDGMTFDQLLDYLKETYGEDAVEAFSSVQQDEQERKQEKKQDWFPLFVNMKKKQVLIVGGGKVAARRLKTLNSFSCHITVTAPECDGQIRELADSSAVTIVEREFMQEDLQGKDFVIAATDNSELNLRIGRIAREAGIYTNIASEKENCDFFFPGVASKGNLTVGVTAQGKDHSLARAATEKIRKLLEDINDEKESDRR
ncbi:MAG: precorrin-6A reductase [Emergencia sp.]